MKKLYEKFVKKPLSSVDSGDLFKKGLNLVFKLAAIALLLSGLYICIIGLFGGNGYFGQLNGDGFFIARSIVTLLITFIVSLVAYAAVGLILWYQGDDIKNNYDGIIFLPSRFLKIAGQTAAVTFVAGGLITLASALFAGMPYSAIGPIQRIVPEQLLIMRILPGRDLSIPSDFLDYLKNLLITGILGMIVNLIMAFVAMIVFYILAHLYEIIVKFFKNGGDYFKPGKK